MVYCVSMSIFGRFGRKTVNTNTLVPLEYTADIVEGEEKGLSVSSVEAYLRRNLGLRATDDPARLMAFHNFSVAVYRAVDIISSTMAAVPLRFGLVNSRGETTPLNNGITTLMKRPNEFQTGNFFMRQTFAYLEMTGNAYWDISDKNGLGITQSMALVRPDRIMPLVDRDIGLTGYRKFLSDGSFVDFPVEDIIHFREINLEDMFVGQGPMQAVSPIVSSDLSAIEWNNSFFKNGARLSGTLTIKTPLGEPAKKRMKRQLNDWFGGKANTGKIMFLEGDQEFKELGQNLKDMDFANLRDSNKQEIFMGFGIPPAVAGIFEGVNFATASEQKKMFYEFKVIPKIWSFVTQLALGFDSQLSRSDGRFIVEADFSGVEALQDDKLKQAQVDDIKVRNGLTFINEVRARDGLEPVPWGDEPVIQAGMILDAEPESLALITDNSAKTKAIQIIEKADTPQRLNRVNLINPLRLGFQGYGKAVGNAFVEFAEENDLFDKLSELIRIRPEDDPELTDNEVAWLNFQLQDFKFFDDIQEQLIEPFRPEQKIVYEKQATFSTTKLRKLAAKSINKDIRDSALTAKAANRLVLTNPEILAALAERESMVINSYEIELFDDYKTIFLEEFFNNTRAIKNETLRPATLFGRVTKLFNARSVEHARTIAITETGAVLNKADRDVYTRNGVTKHEWAHSGNFTNPRENHEKLDGQVADTELGQGFNVQASTVTVGGVAGPHDPALPVSERANCLCDLQPVVDKVLPETLWDLS